MPFAIGSFAAFVSLASGILSQVEPLTTMWRALLAFFAGWLCASIWQAITGLNRNVVSAVADEAPLAEAETS